MQINRSAYSLLDWLGDVGGLFDALRLIASMLAGPFAALALKAELLSQVFRYLAMAEEGKNKDKEDLPAQMAREISSPKKLMHPSYLQCCSSKAWRQQKFV